MLPKEIAQAPCAMVAIVSFDFFIVPCDQLVMSVQVVVGVLRSDNGNMYPDSLKPSSTDSQYPGVDHLSMLGPANQIFILVPFALWAYSRG